MRKDEVLKLLAQHKPELVRRFGITDLALFGSTARDEASEGSDVDLMVEFDGRSTAKRYFGVQFYLEDLLECPIDLVQKSVIRAELKPLYRKGSDSCLSHYRGNGVFMFRT